jgi:hypothetical protein
VQVGSEAGAMIEFEPDVPPQPTKISATPEIENETLPTIRL